MTALTDGMDEAFRQWRIEQGKPLRDGESGSAKSFQRFFREVWMPLKYGVTGGPSGPDRYDPKAPHREWVNGEFVMVNTKKRTT